MINPPNNIEAVPEALAAGQLYVEQTERLTGAKLRDSRNVNEELFKTYFPVTEIGEVKKIVLRISTEGLGVVTFNIPKYGGRWEEKKSKPTRYQIGGRCLIISDEVLPTLAEAEKEQQLWNDAQQVMKEKTQSAWDTEAGIGDFLEEPAPILALARIMGEYNLYAKKQAARFADEIENVMPLDKYGREQYDSAAASYTFLARLLDRLPEGLNDETANEWLTKMYDQSVMNLVTNRMGPDRDAVHEMSKLLGLTF